LRDYLWASPVGRIRTIEKGLLTRSDLAKVLDAGNLEGALMALRDSFYGPYVSKLEHADMFEVALEEAVKAVHDKVMRLAPEPLIIAAYRARYDFHNLKVLLKAEMLQVPAEEGGFSRLGNLTPEELMEALKPVRQGQAPVAPLELEPDSIGESAYKVTCELAAVYARVLAQAEIGQLSSFEVDGLIDKSYYTWAASVYRKSGYDALEEIIRSEIDIINLKMAVRANLLGISSSDFGGILIPGGNVDAARLAEGYIRGYRGVADVYKHTRLEHLANRGVSQAQKGQPLTGWERECDNAMVKLVRQARKISLGPEPVFGYMFGREVEVRNLRIILSGKQSLIPEHEISERLRESYA
jgi:V/A-type H+-transporting ATPase subunit C